jgi:hypothetical protein
MKRWILFARWVKFWALTERYTNPVQKFVLARRRRIVNAAVRIAKEELISRRMDLPTDLDLRRLARRAIHEVRRHRRGFGIRTLLDEPFGHQFLVEFIIKRLKLAPTSSRQVARQLSQEVNR